MNKLFIFETEDGFQIESVFYRGDTLCVSTQVGCPVRCNFCASGSNGFLRNLSCDEIVSQYEILKEKLNIRGIAIAGIGEPTANWKNVINALNYFKSQNLKVTITTTGFNTEGFKAILLAKHDGVTFSVHGFSKTVREKLFPNSFPFEKSKEIFEKHIKNLSKSQRKKYQIGYLLLKGVNHSEKELSLLSEFAGKYSLTVMLMMYNKTHHNCFLPVSEKEYEDAFLFLRKKKIRTTLSNRFRTDPLGGCGTLTINRK
ncbi:radical SAM protein [Desulfurobacterium atlanticum]|uniref:23S rRNA (Adenine2503-C2)-methyltransferase n=1 Tax=Desulfurobacterium atlanticum TaxID=240169 RepID=A0A238YHD5_9BACT|nr:radical SAM protein [Desulfurobacterium atlanticum]SNR70023.1 23S rRNA (adenine2503-C2)-methyltransferase [Desulfurobacterium atlanticum]